ncbi:MAG: dTMP kinase [Candidatus Marsarchaeota archaeon]|nr:dTMP kinase [Candidatus Marsarchaeota archaeon]MCL5431327.1 dTMP kinase [Candidatus Marsarchaeota archaeon]
MLIAFEGLDGSGKTTQARLLFEKLSQSYSCILTKEPTDGPIGLFARDNMKSSTNKDTMENTLLMEAFFIADRIDHVNSVIKPGLESGKVVITDRYVLSTIAYGGVVGIDTNWLAELNKSFPIPDITFLMDIDTQAAMERLKTRATKPQVFENKEFLRVARYIYKNEAQKFKNSHVIDADRPQDAIAAEIFNIVMEQMQKAQKGH